MKTVLLIIVTQLPSFCKIIFKRASEKKKVIFLSFPSERRKEGFTNPYFQSNEEKKASNLFFFSERAQKRNLLSLFSI